MALEIVGAGLGRTGTLSLKLALEQLGYDPCHHMMEVFRHPETAAFWNRAADGEAVDWEEGYKGYRATVDWPGCRFWRELTALYPEAKVILSVRPAARWYESMSETILKAIARQDDAAQANPFRFAGQVVRDTLNCPLDEAALIAAFERHVAEVKAAIPPERLLVFEAAHGWGPLCAFLGKHVPASPYPRTNSREEFWSHTLPQEARDA